MYAENPPKRYEDIYPFDFAGAAAADREALWRAWLEVVMTWVGRGIRIFRVDNPHTKPVAFWALADRRGAGRRSRRHLPGGGLHHAEADAGTGQGRLQPELYLLHLARDAATRCATT